MTSNRRILLVVDDEDLREMLTEQLQIHEEFLTESIGNGTDAIERAKEQYFDIILLDVSLPDIDGCEVCRIMRYNGVKSPMIMLTEADTDADTILGREAGANDYITKPFRIGVLMARLRAHIREHEQSEYAVFAIGPYTFRPAAKQLLDNETNKKVRLTDKETSIIKYLFLAGERVVSRDVLLDEVWGYNAGVTTHTLETHVYRLRQKIERNPSNAVLLVTEPNGYRLVP
ncbi:MAG: response regulator transcription factor [Pseudomonadota bacterium]|nr:response regulator transcription factor [Pseudomonadota bacterium]